jgi:molybdenum cofactor biosynthesis enzyme MoaA
MDKPIAIRSLQCADHAMNIPPTIITINWLIGKRCNYDCSYCSPHVHDSVSPFIDSNVAEKFVINISKKLSRENKKIKWCFTGGEPFLDPGFLRLLRVIKDTGNAEQINITTNGSLPLDTYQSVISLVDGITISLHLERNQTEIDHTVDKIISLSKSGIMISSNVMLLPGRLSQVQEISNKFKKYNVHHVIRKIIYHEFVDDYQPFLLNFHNMILVFV